MPVLGRRPVATPIFRKLCSPIHAPMPEAMIRPCMSFALAAIKKHLTVISKIRITTAQHPIKPNVSPITVKIKSVCDSEMYPVSKKELAPSTPFFYILPDPMAIMEFVV